MTNQSLCLQVCVLCLAVCLSSSSQTKDDTWSRLKRGFRVNSASRVAHGYGKRGYGAGMEDFPTFSSSQRLRPETDIVDLAKDEDWSLLSVEELASLLQTHPKLTRSLIKKLLDTDDDGMISANELFSPNK